eukprot:5855870-Pleurochrysis_carterae.AAC.2
MAAERRTVLLTPITPARICAEHKRTRQSGRARTWLASASVARGTKDCSRDTAKTRRDSINLRRTCAVSSVLFMTVSQSLSRLGLKVFHPPRAPRSPPAPPAPAPLAPSWICRSTPASYPQRLYHFCFYETLGRAS